MFIASVYSHAYDFDAVVQTVRDHFPRGSVELSRENESRVLLLTLPGGLLKKRKELKLTYRQRSQPSYQLQGITDSFTQNLNGMQNFVASLPAQNTAVRHQLLQKIATLNSEFSFWAQPADDEAFLTLLRDLSLQLDAILFAQPKTAVSQSATQHFLDKNLHLLIDLEGRCAVDHLDVIIQSALYHQHDEPATEEQLQRRERSHRILASQGLTLPAVLGVTAAAAATTLRTPKEVATRVAVLTVVSQLAFNYWTVPETKEYLHRRQLWEALSPREKYLVEHPSDEHKTKETWKAECIWILLWALYRGADTPGFPHQMSQLNQIAGPNYPLLHEGGPQGFIEQATTLRPVHEILDLADLYYRLDWICTDARLHHNEETLSIIPGVVYERHYALNWLTRYRNQDWDDVTCDT